MLVSTHGIPSSRVYPSFMVPPYMNSQSVRLTISNDQKRFEGFIHLGTPKFSDIVGEYAYEFLIECMEKFHNLGSLESYGVANTTHQLKDISRD